MGIGAAESSTVTETIAISITVCGYGGQIPTPATHCVCHLNGILTCTLLVCPSCENIPKSLLLKTSCASILYDDGLISPLCQHRHEIDLPQSMKFAMRAASTRSVSFKARQRKHEGDYGRMPGSCRHGSFAALLHSGKITLSRVVRMHHWATWRPVSSHQWQKTVRMLRTQKSPRSAGQVKA